jgi:ABC-type polar amino acid transport system ATPase subunit
MIRVKHLTKSFGSLTVLCDVDLHVEENEVVAIIGPSGSGKSTLLRCINWLEIPSGGEISVDGEAITPRTDLPRVRSKLGMVFQHFNLFPHLTALGNVIEAPIHVLGMPRQTAEAWGRELLSQVGLSDKADVHPAKLSGGQKQRVAIARSLAMRPKALLLDEVTSALDPELVGEVLIVLRRLAKQGMTMVIVTHEMRFAREVADRIVFMDEGRIIEEGPPEQTLVDPQSARLRKFLRAVIDQAAMDEALQEGGPVKRCVNPQAATSCALATFTPFTNFTPR